MDRKYNLKLDLQFRCNNSKMIFDEFDENTSDFFMQISRQGKKIDISNVIPTLLVLKPSGVAVSQILNVKDDLIYGNLNNSLKNEVGTYIAKLMLVEGDKKIFISNISYEVTENALLGKIDNDIVEDERYSVLIQLLERLSNIELQEQTRVDNENSRVEAEQSREQIFQNLQDEVKDLLDKGLDLSSLATKEELNELSEELETHTHNEYALKEEIPTKISNLENDSNYLTEIPSDYITEIELNTKGYLTEHQDISHLATKKELFSKDYNDLTNKPTIPSIDGLATKTYVNEEIKKIDVASQLGDYAKKSDIPVVPTKISAFNNDKGYLTSVPGEYVTEAELNSKGYLTEHQDLSNYATKSELHNHTNKIVLDNITSAKVAEWNNKSTFSGSYNDLTNKPSIPTKTSQLTNDSKFITTIPSEYITETELNAKGYLTEHQDISNKVDKVSGKGLSTNDYTTSEKNKLAGIEAGANNVKVYTAKECTTFTSDAGTCTPLAVQKAVGLFPPKAHEHSQYLTEHQDISGLATKEYVDNAITNLNIDIDYDSLLAFDTNEIITTTNYVDSDNNIILDDDLPAGAYTLKYEFEDGTYTDIREFTIEGGHN